MPDTTLAPPNTPDAIRPALRAHTTYARALVGPPLIATHHDADGLSSGALLARMWERLAGQRPTVRLVGRGENAWDDAFAASVADLDAPGLAVADLGVAGRRPAPHVPLAVIDHHVPTGAPDDATVVSGYGLDPVPTTSLLAHWCAWDVLGKRADDLLWLAAVGLIGDLGDKAPFDALPVAKKRYGAGKLRELTTLVNAPRRSATGDASAALALLMNANDPADALSGRHPQAEACQAAREEVKAELDAARRIAPRFPPKASAVEDVAVIPVDSACQVHPLVAQSWVGRLKGKPVFAANFGFEPGTVHISGRAPKGVNLIDLLARHRPAGADRSHYGNGHERAAGGALPLDQWDEWCASLGFDRPVRP